MKMEWLNQFGRRLRQLFRRKQWEDDLAEEMRLHLDLRAADKGSEALAQRKFGNAALLREESRSVWGWAFWDALAQDVRYAVRTLAANKGFAAAAILSLTLGIGANTAIFSIVNAVMLRALPVEDPQRLVALHVGMASDDRRRGAVVTNPIWEAVRDSQQAFSGVLAYSDDRFDLADGGESHFSNGLWVSGDFFRVLGVPALRGRVFTTDDDRHGGGRSGPVAVVSYAFWQANFAGDPNVLGRIISLNRHNFEIVGVTPSWFRGLIVDQPFDVAIPIGCEPLLHTDMSALGHRSWWWLRMIGRLKPGETPEQAQARMNSIAPEINRATVPTGWDAAGQVRYLKRSFWLKSGAAGISITGSTYKTALFTLMSVVGLVLLIACVNIANLLLARATSRQREISVRLAIGASRSRVIRQLLTESLLLAFAGAVCGLLSSVWGARLLVRMLSTKANQIDISVSPDLRVLVFTAAIAVFTGLLFGLAPALRATGIGPNHALKENARGTVQGGARFTLGKALVTGQVALSLMLLAAAGLFLGTMRNFLKLDPGFNPHNVLLVKTVVPADRIQQQLRTHLFSKILSDLRALPNVRSAASSMMAPVAHGFWNQDARPEGYQRQPGEDDVLVNLNRVSPAYFRTMETSMLMGRDFSDRDTLASPKAMIVGEETARHFWANQNPIGKTIALEAPGSDVTYQVVGVVRNAKYSDLDEPLLKTGFVASTQDPDPGPEKYFEIRFDGPAEAVTAAVRLVIAAINRDAALEIRTLDDRISDSLVQPRLVALLSSFFGFLALLLATIGLYGVISYAAARRRGEIGIRMALGAAEGAVTWLILRDVALILTIGTALGVGVSLVAGRLIKSLLFGLEASNPATLTLAAVVLCTSAIFAAYLPARRAAKMDPMTALREE
jgi:putative ABC transport system permease protein